VARGIRAARGRYICMLDGDDYWIAKDKIERQASLLDADDSLAACFHNAVIVRGDAEAGDERWTPVTQATRMGKVSIWRGNPFATCTGMLRASALRELGPWYARFFPVTDWPLYILCSEHGDLLFIDEVVGAYWLHGGGLFSSLPGKRKLAMIADCYRRMDGALGGRCHDSARAGASVYFCEWAEEYARRGDRAMSRACLVQAVRAGGVGRSVPWRRWLPLAARSLR
jgi:glycosyltransferase involved in cell wall biosynthesis